ncbi:MAG TPA: hypothetical protein VM165_00615 [Planctomycetaceae bacterium]|nr:hypothetical protein [Planctomycetaceae bacterium]
MQTVPQALIWELLTRGRWSLMAAVCGANLLPAFLFTALRHQGGLDTADPSFVIMQVVLVQLNMFAFGSAVMTAQGQLSRLYAYPIRSSTIVLWHLVPAMGLMALETLVSLAALNAAFGLGWSLWGPALFAAVALAAIEATMWLTEKSAWLPLSVGTVGAGLGLWFNARHGAIFSQPVHRWEAVTPVEVVTLLLFAVVAYAVAVFAVSRNRRGDPLPVLGIKAWWERTFDQPLELRTQFRTPAEAQLWFEWRKKGWAMPACVVFGLVVGGFVWLIFSRKGEDLFAGLIGGGGVLSLVGFICGLILGNSGPNDANFAMGHFLGTRPLTNSQFSRIILWTAAKSVGWAWLLWATPLVVLYLALVPTGLVSLPLLRDDQWRMAWWYVPVTFLGPWTVMTFFATIGLTGRSRPFVDIMIGGFALFIGGNVFSSYALTFEQQRMLGQGIIVTLGVVAVLGTSWLFHLSRRRELIAAPSAWISLGLWAVLTTGVAVAKGFDPRMPLAVCVFMAGAIALVVAPIAATPLAIAWNRTR